MQIKHLFLWCLVVVFVIFGAHAGGGDGHHKHVKIYVPYHVKTIKHTHTVYKTVHHHHKDEDEGHHSHDHKDHGHGWM